MNKPFKRFFVSSLISSLVLCSTMVDAKNINLYEEPKPDTKVIGNIETNSGIVSIFKSSDGQWIKVGDPKNGNTGWVKAADLGDKNISFNMFQSNDGNHQYQIIQYGNTKPMTPAEISTAMKQMEQHRQMIQKDMQKIMHDMFADMQYGWLHSPMVLPVVMVPIKDAQQQPTQKQVSESKSQIQKTH